MSAGSESRSGRVIRAALACVLGMAMCPAGSSAQAVSLVGVEGPSGCVVMRDNQVRCFRHRESPDDFSTVGRLPGRVAELSLGEGLACARTTGDDVYCWGVDAFRPDFDQVESAIERCWAGDRDGSRCEAAVTMRAERAAARIRRVARRVNAISVEGDTLCTTHTVTGELICARADQRSDPDDEPASWKTACTGRAVHVAAGDGHSCAVTSEGHAYCWGELGDDAFEPAPACVGRLMARRLRGVTDAARVFVGSDDVCIQHRDRTLSCRPARTSHVGRVDPLPGLGPVRDVSMGDDAGCAQTDDMQVHCWGSNATAHLGVGDMLPHDQPVLVPRLAASSGLAVSYALSCGVVRGTLRCAGALPSGWVEDPDADRFVPLRDAHGVQVSGIDIAANGLSACARLFDRTWVCTDLDAATTRVVLTPWAGGRTDVAYVAGRASLTEDGVLISRDRTMPDVVALVGNTLPCALRRDGHVYCFESYLPEVHLRARRIVRDEPVVEVRADDIYVCTRSTSGRVQCTARPAGRDVTPIVRRGTTFAGFAGADPATLCLVTDGGEQRCVHTESEYLLRALDTRLPGAGQRDTLEGLACALDATGTLTCAHGATVLAALPNVSRFRLGPDFAVALDAAGRVWVFASRMWAPFAHAGRHPSLTPVHVDIPTMPLPFDQPRLRVASLDP